MDQFESVNSLASLALNAAKPEVSAILLDSDIYPIEALPKQILPPLVSFANAFSIFAETEKCLDVRVLAQHDDVFSLEFLKSETEDRAKPMLMFVEVWTQIIAECDFQDGVLNVTPIANIFKPSRFNKVAGEELKPDELIPVVIAYGLDKAGVLDAEVTSTLAKKMSIREETSHSIGPSL